MEEVHRAKSGKEGGASGSSLSTLPKSPCARQPGSWFFWVSWRRHDVGVID